MKPKVYLFGALLGQTFKDTIYWRKFAEEFLQPHIITLSPTRGLVVANPDEPFQAEYPHDIMHQQKGFTERDLLDIRQSELLLGYFGGTKMASIGSMIELGYAKALNKPVVMCIPENHNVHNHPMVRELALVTTGLKEGLAAVLHLLLPSEILNSIDVDQRYNDVKRHLSSAEGYFWNRG